MATGDILAVRIANHAAHNGWVAEVDLEGLAVGSNLVPGLGANNDPSTAKLVLTVTSEGYDAAASLGTIVRTVYGTYQIRMPYASYAIPGDGNGTFMDGETVTQTTTGATAIVFGVTTGTSLALIVHTLTAGSNASDVWTGSSSGFVFTPTGAPASRTRDQRVDGTTLTIKCALSDFIYNDDTVSVAIASGFYPSSNTLSSTAATNNSTLDYPKPIGRWAWPGYEQITSADFLVEFVAFHKGATGGQPLACVKIAAIGETSAAEVTKTITAMTVSTRTGDACKVLVYAATFTASDLAGFTDNEVVRFEAICYPWVGDADALLNTETSADGVAQPDERMGPLYALYDPDNDYCGAACVVDVTNGNASAASTWVRADRATVESLYDGGNTNSYTTIGYAVQALKAYNNANKGHNDPGGGFILLTGATNVYPGTTPSGSQGAQSVWVTITNKTGASPTISSGTIANLNAKKVKVSGVAITASSTAVFYSGAITTDMFWLDNNAINHTGSGGVVYAWQLVYATQNVVTAWANNTATSGLRYYSLHSPYALVRGNTAPVLAIPLQGEMYCGIGNLNLTAFPLNGTVPATTYAISQNAIWAFNRSRSTNTSMVDIFTGKADIDVNDIAIVQNVYESTSTNQPTTQIAAVASHVATSSNILFWHNTTVGARNNQFYNTTGETAHCHTKHSYVGNEFDELCQYESDTTATANAARTGGWSFMYGVGLRSNVGRTATFPTTFKGLWAKYGFNEDYVSNKSSRGDAAGGGDYHLIAGSDGLDWIPSGLAVLPFDLDGVARRNDGTGAAGAYEYVPTPFTLYRRMVAWFTHLRR